MADESNKLLQKEEMHNILQYCNRTTQRSFNVVVSHFYRATLCCIFFAVERCPLSVHPSVRPSVCLSRLYPDARLNISSSFTFYCATQICIARTCYGDVAGCTVGWLSDIRGIIKAKRILKLFRSLVAPSFYFLETPAPIPNSKGNPFSGGVKYTVVGKISDFPVIFDGNRRLSRKRCEIGRWLLWNVNRKSWVPD